MRMMNKPYPTYTKIINSTIDDDQINSNIQFDSVKGNVNSGSVEKDTHVYDMCALETLARNAYDEAAKQQRFAQKVQQQNETLTSQIEMYKERNRVLENITKDNNYLKEFLKADEKAKRFQKQADSQLYRDREIIQNLEKQRDELSQEVKPLLNGLLDHFDGFQNLFQRDIKKMKDAFEQNDVYLDEIESTIEPKNIKEAMADHSWIESMQDELNQFERLQVWELVPRPAENKTERIDFEDVICFCAHLEAVRMFIAFAAHRNITIFQWMSKRLFSMVL
ncbi:hypothetical protein Tco_0708437 [Tanacetum coccineum]